MIEALARWDAGLTARRMVLALSGLLVAVVALSWLSLEARTFGVPLAGITLIATALLFPRLGLALLVMIAPIQKLWGLTSQDMALQVGLLMAAVNLRHVGEWRRLAGELRKGAVPPLLLVFGAFILLYLLRGLAALPDMGETQMHAAGREAAFLTLLFGAALAVRRHCLGTNADAMRLGLIGAVGLALALTLAIDTIGVYFNALALRLRLLPEWQGMRLAGLHSNPNATAKFLLAGLAFTLVALWRWAGLEGGAARFRRWYGWPLALAAAAVCALALGATSSKATLLGAIGALVVVAALCRHRRRHAVAVLVSAGAVLALALTYNAALSLGLGRLINANRETVQLPPPRPMETNPLVLAERVGQSLRVGQSHEMVVHAPPPPAAEGPPAKPFHSEIYRNIDGVIEYKARDCGLGCTGQRDRLWKTGLAVWAEHWLVGIGPAAWPEQYRNRLHFPFDTPHNVVLELAGGFGLGGLAAYAALAVIMLRLSQRVFAHPPSAPAAAILGQGTLLFALAIMVTEWGDPAKFLAMNPHAMWLWPLLAGATAMDGAGKDGSAAPGSP